MKFLSLLAAAVFATTAAAEYYKECNEGPFAPLLLVGDKHDASKYDVDICEQQYTTGAVVSGVDVWGSKSRISGILLTYSNGQKSHMVGARDGDHQKLEWGSSTTVTSVKLWSDWDARQLGGLRIELSDNRSLDMRLGDSGKDRISAKVFSPDVGSGILLGGFGTADNHITSWGWMFLESKVEKFTVNDFKFDQSIEQYRKEKSKNERLIIDTQVEYNVASRPLTMHMDKRSDKRNSYSYSQSSTLSFGFGYELEISGQVAGVGPKSSFSVELKTSFENTQEWTKSDDAGLTAKTIHECPPGMTAMCIGYAEFDEFKMDYEATVTIKLKSGKTFSFRERGTKEQTLYAKTQVKCADQQGDHTKEDPYEFVERRIEETRKEAEKKEEEKKKQEEAARNGTKATAPSNSTATPKRSGVVSLFFNA
ncbi:hypothetical protein DM02DRAFT_688447 [Periconia macrospinosa]|uniref:Jacalin-type lectin domain-containing protein n=1 Tax=Periconia macrospinosa TaxID=97972 RepID=A0A2V1DG81_9PLEO|nr:hypothetical protein DM02DRAFT_688447 [Periconia macrospinosa]